MTTVKQAKRTTRTQAAPKDANGIANSLVQQRIRGLVAGAADALERANLPGGDAVGAGAGARPASVAHGMGKEGKTVAAHALEVAPPIAKVEDLDEVLKKAREDIAKIQGGLMSADDAEKRLEQAVKELTMSADEQKKLDDAQKAKRGWLDWTKKAPPKVSAQELLSRRAKKATDAFNDLKGQYGNLTKQASGLKDAQFALGMRKLSSSQRYDELALIIQALEAQKTELQTQLDAAKDPKAGAQQATQVAEVELSMMAVQHELDDHALQFKFQWDVLDGLDANLTTLDKLGKMVQAELMGLGRQATTGALEVQLQSAMAPTAGAAIDALRSASEMRRTVTTLKDSTTRLVSDCAVVVGSMDTSLKLWRTNLEKIQNGLNQTMDAATESARQSQEALIGEAIERAMTVVPEQLKKALPQLPKGRKVDEKTLTLLDDAEKMVRGQPA